MTLAFHNTLTKHIDPFTPLTPGQAGIYSCGPTVYDHAHIGNLSAFIMADILRRTLSASGLEVKHVMNFTDVDDKTIRRSRTEFASDEPMSALRKLTQRYGNLFLEDMQAIGNDTSALTIIKAADDTTIEGMRQLITELHKQGFAYIADDGVYFSIAALLAPSSVSLPATKNAFGETFWVVRPRLSLMMAISIFSAACGLIVQSASVASA